MALTREAPGHSPEKPMLVGAANDDEPVEIIATALVAGIRKGATKWVTGDGVQDLIERGAFVRVVRAPGEPEPEPAPEPVAEDGTGTADELAALQATLDARREAEADERRAAARQATNRDATPDPVDDGDDDTADDDGEADDGEGDDDVEYIEMPPKSASKAAWVEYAEAAGVEGAAAKTKDQLITECGE